MNVGGDGRCPWETKTKCNKITPILSNDFNLGSEMLPSVPLCFPFSFFFVRKEEAGL